MDKKNKKEMHGKDDFLRYHSGNMEGEERNAFEKELQKDPFAEEASEGFSLLRAEEAEEEMIRLSKRLKKRIKRSNRAIYFRIAAAAAVLVTISVLLVYRQGKEEVTLSLNETERYITPFEITESQPIKERTEKSAIEKGNRLQNEVQTQTLEDSRPLADKDFSTVTESGAKNIIAATGSKESEAQQVQPVDSDEVSEDMISVPEVKEAAMMAKSEKKRTMPEMEGEPSPVSAKGISASDHTPPQPVKGIDLFNKYVEKNIRNPKPGQEKEEVVIISFVVRTDSTITDIKIIDSPGQPYSAEAKRLIKEGPEWRPATINGLPVKKEYQVTIRFR